MAGATWAPGFTVCDIDVAPWAGVAGTLPAVGAGCGCFAGATGCAPVGLTGCFVVYAVCAVGFDGAGGWAGFACAWVPAFTGALTDVVDFAGG